VAATHRALQEIDNPSFTRRETAVVRVVSAVIPEENHFFFKPVHPDFARIRWTAPQHSDSIRGYHGLRAASGSAQHPWKDLGKPKRLPGWMSKRSRRRI